MTILKKILHRPFFIKLLHWEFWPFHAVYTPIYLYWVWLCIRARSFFFFNTSNPTIKNGGFLLESKKEIYDLIPPQFYPKTILIKANTSFTDIKETVEKFQLKFPLIGKPLGDPGISITRQIDEKELVVDTVKIDCLRSARCIACECQLFVSGEGVNQAGLANVTSP